MAKTASPAAVLSTGSTSLDRVLGGGITRGALAVIVGVPGSGKTTLAGQIAFHIAGGGHNTLILTALTEPTSKLLSHLQTFTFYTPALVGNALQVLSLQQALPDGLATTADQILDMARKFKAQLIILDGFQSAHPATLPVAHEARSFLYLLGTTLGTLGVTTIVTSEAATTDPAMYPEMTTADVVMGMHFDLDGVRHRRGIAVIKARGAEPMPGLHTLTLDTHGVTVFPQFEERVAAAVRANPDSASPLPRERVAFDLPELDALLHGGVQLGSSTVLAGSLGTGKTLLALHFALAGVRAGEPVVFLSVRETRAQLELALDPFASGSAFAQALAPGGLLTLIDALPIKLNADIIADRLLTTLDQTGARRLVIDSLAELERAVARGSDPARLEDYLVALLAALRQRQVTALMIKETAKIVAPMLDFSTEPLAVLAENLLLLQQLPYNGQLHRIISVLKQRYSAHDSALREFVIAPPAGIRMLAPLETGAGMLDNLGDATLLAADGSK
jgi:circadian clock protein KaiC